MDFGSLLISPFFQIASFLRSTTSVLVQLRSFRFSPMWMENHARLLSPLGSPRLWHSGDSPGEKFWWWAIFMGKQKITEASFRCWWNVMFLRPAGETCSKYTRKPDLSIGSILGSLLCVGGMELPPKLNHWMVSETKSGAKFLGSADLRSLHPGQHLTKLTISHCELFT